MAEKQKQQPLSCLSTATRFHSLPFSPNFRASRAVGAGGPTTAAAAARQTAGVKVTEQRTAPVTKFNKAKI